MLKFLLFIALSLSFSNLGYSATCSGKVRQIRVDGHATYFTLTMSNGHNFRHFLCGKDQNGTTFSCDGRMSLIFWALAENRDIHVFRPDSMGCYVNSNYQMPFALDTN